MAFQKVVATVEINMNYTLNFEAVQNTYYARLPGGYLQADLQALANKVDLAFPGAMQPFHPPEVTYNKTEVRGLEFPNDLVAESAVSTGVGTAASISLPNQVTFSIKKTSGLTGRSARGRNYWVGIPRNELDPLNENLVLAAFAANLVASIAFVRTSITSVGLWEAVLVSRFELGAKRPEGKVFLWIDETNVDLRVDTLRGRLPA